MVTHLSQAEEVGFPYGLCCMIAQVLIIVVLNDGRPLAKDVLQIFVKEGGVAQ